MKEKINVAKIKTKGKGVFSMDDLYRNMKYWLDFQGYGDHTKSFKEEKYVERVRGDTKQIEIRWNAEKIVSDYFSFVMTITFFVLGLKSAEIEKDGKKISTNKGEVEIRFTADWVIDKKNKWKNRIFQSAYNNFVVRDRIESYKTDLYDNVYSLYDEVKAYLEMHRA